MVTCLLHRTCITLISHNSFKMFHTYQRRPRKHIGIFGVNLKFVTMCILTGSSHTSHTSTIDVAQRYKGNKLSYNTYARTAKGGTTKMVGYRTACPVHPQDKQPITISSWAITFLFLDFFLWCMCVNMTAKK